MKKEDNIEKLILDNIDMLNDNEPMEGHFARFEEKLNKQHKTNKSVKLNTVWKVAAAVVFIFLATNQAFIYFSPTNQGIFNSQNKATGITLASISTEYQEVEFYYTNSISTSINQWNRWIEQGLVSDEEQNLMNDELAEFEKLYKSLQKDLAATPNDQRVISAMLEYYQAKLNVINIIITKLKEVQQESKDFEPETTAV